MRRSFLDFGNLPQTRDPRKIQDRMIPFDKVRYLDTSGPSMARRSTRPWERRHLLATDWGRHSQGMFGKGAGDSRRTGEATRKSSQSSWVAAHGTTIV